MPPDIKVALAENETIEKIEQGKLRMKEVNIYIKIHLKMIAESAPMRIIY